MWLQPHWSMWYLCVLFFWRLATPILRRHWAAIPIAVGISMLGGLYDELWFGIPRILGQPPAVKVMAIGLLGIASVLALIPAKLGRFSRMGSQTLAVYLCHGFFVRYAEYAGRGPSGLAGGSCRVGPPESNSVAA